MMKLKNLFYSTVSKVELPISIFKIAVGQLLRDAHADKSSPTSNTRLSWSFGSSYKLYRDFIADNFKNYCGTGVKSVIVWAKKDNINYVNYRLKTLSLPRFNKLHNIFYILDNNNKYIKIVPPQIMDIMCPIVLAHLIIGDGGFDKNRNRVRIFTYSFTYLDCLLLAKSISVIDINTKVIFDRKSKLGVDQYVLTIGRSELSKLRNMVLPYICKSILYRMGI
jgi:hypothetical protein